MKHVKLFGRIKSIETNNIGSIRSALNSVDDFTDTIGVNCESHIITLDPTHVDVEFKIDDVNNIIIRDAMFLVSEQVLSKLQSLIPDTIKPCKGEYAIATYNGNDYGTYVLYDISLGNRSIDINKNRGMTREQVIEHFNDSWTMRFIVDNN